MYIKRTISFFFTEYILALFDSVLIEDINTCKHTQTPDSNLESLRYKT